MNRKIFLISGLIVLVLVTAQACGPEFFPDVFVRKLRPDQPKEFAAGKLGILLPTYPRADLAVAYRYLVGGTLNAEEQRAYQPISTFWEEVWQDEETVDKEYWKAQEEADKLAHQPIEDWRQERAKYAEAQPVVEQNRSLQVSNPNGNSYWVDYQNCPVDAFRNAVAGLKVRAQAWGAKSPALVDWLKAQDIVFSNCSGHGYGLPAAAPADAPPLLKSDRAYQRAAAEFYAGEYEPARKDFAAIAQDKSSPWQSLSAYLVARCLVRQAFNSSVDGGEGSRSSYRAELMRLAAGKLRELQANRPPGVSAEAIQKLLDLVRLRVETDARLAELAAAVSGPAPDPAYDQHLKDLTWYLNSELDSEAIREDFGDTEQGPASKDAFAKAFKDTEKLRATSTLVDWLISFQSPADEAGRHALAEWKRTGSVPWLVAALAKAEPGEPQAAALMAAAAKIPPSAPAWETATYYRLRLAIATGHAPEARTELDRILPALKAGNRQSSTNAFLALRMSAAPELGEFLSFAPRKLLSAESESAASQRECVEVMKDPKRVYDCTRDLAPVQFAPDAAAILNTQAPLDTLASVADSSQLPAGLARSVAMMGWTRAVLAADDAAAAKFFPRLPQKLQQQAGQPTGFHALMTLARNPGLRPYLDGGVQRSESYDFVESYRDNWWCSQWVSSDYSNTAAPLSAPIATFVTPMARAEAASQVEALRKLGPADLALGSRILDYVNAHAGDPDSPEALYLVLRMIRYSCGDLGPDSAESKQRQARVNELRKEAARLLRQKYAASPWTKKAAPFVG